MRGGREAAQGTLNTDKQVGLDTPYDAQAIDDAQTQVQQAQATLEKDSAQLAADQKAASAAASTAKSSQANADSLATQAKNAQDRADAAAAASWHHQNRLEVFVAQAANVVRTDARSRAIKNAAIGGGLALSALTLLMLDALPRRRSTGARSEARTTS